MYLLYLATVLYAFYYYVKFKLRRRRLENMVEKFDGPPGIPILGNVVDFLKSPTDIVKTINKTLATYNGQYRFWLINRPFIVIGTAEDFEIVSRRTLEKDESYRFIGDMIGDNILTSKVEKWKKHRRIINSALNPLVYFNHFLEVFNKWDKDFVKDLYQEVGTGRHFDLWPYAIRNSVAKICETALGYEGGERGTEAMNYGHALIEGSKIASKRIYQYWLMPSFDSKLYAYLTGGKKLAENIGVLPRKVLKERKERLKHLSSKNHTRAEEEKELRNFIDVLLNDTEGLTDEDICGEIAILTIGASETTALTTCFLMLMLGNEQNIQEKVYREIFRVFGDSDRLPEQRDLNKLPYLEQCIKETLRMFSVAPAILRSVSEDIALSNGKIIPAGTTAFLSIKAIHKNPDIYPNPDTWDPSNFDPERVASRHKCSFVGFSAGPRGCVGQKYAFLSLKAQISTLLRNFKVTTDAKLEDIDLNTDLLIRSKNGYNVKLEIRNGKPLF